MINIDNENTQLMKSKPKYFKAFLFIALVVGFSSCKVFKKPCGCNDFGIIENNQQDSLVFSQYKLDTRFE